MAQKNIIISSLRESLASIWKNKFIFLSIFMLQVVFFSLVFFVSQIYLVKILENARDISDYLGKQNLDDISVTQNILHQQNILGDDPLSITRHYNEMAGNFRIYMAYVFALTAVFLSLLWGFSGRIMHKGSFRELAKHFFRIFIVLAAYLGLLFSFFYSIFSISFAEAAYNPSKIFIKYSLIFFVSVILAYFMLVSLSLLHRTKLKSIVQRTLAIGIRKMHYILAVYFMNALLIAISVILLYYFIEGNFFVVIASISLMFFSFLYGRIFLINVVEKLDSG